MNAAVIGLIGAVVGGAITAGSNFLVEWQRSKSAQADRADAALVGMLRAGRLVAEELFEVLFIIDRAIEDREWWPPDTTLPTRMWEEHAATLAVEWDDDLWSWTSTAYAIIADRNRHVEHHRRHGHEPPWEQDTLRRLGVDSNEVYGTLNELRAAIGLHRLTERKEDWYLRAKAGQLRFDLPGV